MNLAAEARALTRVPERSHLDWPESEAIHILREVAGECSNPALLFSGGKDSAVVLRLAEKASRPACARLSRILPVSWASKGRAAFQSRR